MLNKLRKEQGFTLIELLIVVAIIGILAAIAIPQFSAYRQKGFNAAAVADIKNSKTAQESMFADFQGYGKSAPNIMLTNATNVAGAGTLIPGAMGPGTSAAAGAVLDGPRASDGTACGIGVGISNGVKFYATSAVVVAPANASNSYIMATKHDSGTRVYFTETESTALMFVQNDAWAGGALNVGGTTPTGLAGIPAAADNTVQIDATTSGGGLPTDKWAAM